MVTVVHVLREGDIPHAPGDGSGAPHIALVEVVKNGAEVPVFYPDVLRECAKLRTRGGRSKKRTKRDEGPEYARSLTHVYVLDEGTPQGVKAAALMESAHRVVRTCTPGWLLPFLAGLSDVDGVSRLGIALACLWSGAFAPPQTRRKQPRDWLCVTDAADTLREWSSRMEREYGERPLLLYACAAGAAAAAPLPAPALRVAGSVGQPSPLGVLIVAAPPADPQREPEGVVFPCDPAATSRYVTYLHGLGAGHELVHEGGCTELGDRMLEDVPTAPVASISDLCAAMEAAAASVVPSGVHDVQLDAPCRAAGWVGYIRHTGPVGFVTLLDEGGARLRVAVRAADADAASVKALAAVGCGDYVWVEGHLGCTRKGKLTVFATKLRRQGGAQRRQPARRMEAAVAVLSCALEGVVAYHKPAGMLCVPVGNMQPKDYPTALQVAGDLLGARLAPLASLPLGVSGVCLAYRSAAPPPEPVLQQMLRGPLQFHYVALASPDIAAGALDGTVLAEFGECRARLASWTLAPPPGCCDGTVADVKAVHARLSAVSDKEAGARWGAVNGTSSATCGIDKVFSKRYGLRRIGVHLHSIAVSGARVEDPAAGALYGVMDALPVACVAQGGSAHPFLALAGVRAPGRATLRAEVVGDVACTLASQIGTIRAPTLLRLFPRVAEKLHHLARLADAPEPHAALLLELLAEVPSLFAVRGDRISLASYAPGKAEELAGPLAELVHRQVLQSKHGVRGRGRAVSLTVRLLIPLVGWRLKEYAFAAGMSHDDVAGRAEHGGDVKNELLGQLAQQLMSFVSDSDACRRLGVRVGAREGCPERRKAEVMGGSAAHPEDCCCSWTVVATPFEAPREQLEAEGTAALPDHPTPLLLVRDAHRVAELARAELELLGWERPHRVTPGLYTFARRPAAGEDMFSTCVRGTVATMSAVDLDHQRPVDILTDSAAGILRGAAAAAGGRYRLVHEIHHGALAGATSAEQDLPFVALHVLARFVSVFAAAFGSPCSEADVGDAPTFTLHYINTGRRVVLSRAEAPVGDATSARYDEFLAAWDRKPFVFSGSMEAGVAAVIVHLALLSAGLRTRAQWARARVVDGCCGSGTLSAAASFVFGCQVHASELQAGFAANARENHVHLFGGTAGAPHVIAHDATAPYPTSFAGPDVVLCNPPWGVNFGSECDSLPILLALARSFPDAVWCFVAPRHANAAFLACDTPAVQQLRRMTFGSVEVLIAKRKEGAP
eukprot:TRINITY_DN30093_c0_g1_i1.p1 TRINITY_DN30093_c0_g1~~TRINITY_DN30093_c0_g1_i1.p1  ORF type:complete len:1238 (+),score=255.64 TRINITY_DN30093_c0_g1_i1:76-3789(+)